MAVAPLGSEGLTRSCTYHLKQGKLTKVTTRRHSDEEGATIKLLEPRNVFSKKTLLRVAV